MRYDPIKKVFGDIIRKNTHLRILFYKLLGVMFLREWYVKRELRAPTWQPEYTNHYL